MGNASGTSLSQGFHTGDHDGGYLLSGVSVAIDANNFRGSETATFKIYDSESNETPKDEIYELVTPTGLTTDNTTGTVFFVAPAGSKLEPDTNYFVVFQGAGGSMNSDLQLSLTDSDDQSRRGELDHRGRLPV